MYKSRKCLCHLFFSFRNENLIWWCHHWLLLIYTDAGGKTILYKILCYRAASYRDTCSWCEYIHPNDKDEGFCSLNNPIHFINLAWTNLKDKQPVQIWCVSRSEIHSHTQKFIWPPAPSFKWLKSTRNNRVTGFNAWIPFCSKSSRWI